MLEIRAKFDKVERSRKPSKSCWTSVRLLNESFFDSTFISVFRLPTWRHLWIQSTLNRNDGGKLLFAWSVCVLRDILRNSHPTSLMMKINVENFKVVIAKSKHPKKVKIEFSNSSEFHVLTPSYKFDNFILIVIDLYYIRKSQWTFPARPSFLSFVDVVVSFTRMSHYT